MKRRIWKELHPPQAHMPQWRLREPDETVRLYRTWHAAINGWPSHHPMKEWPEWPA